MNADSHIARIGKTTQGYNLYYYCFNNPTNMSDTQGQWPQWFDWDDFKEDVANFNIFNESEEKALESHYFSIYKGVPVFRYDGERSFTFGVIMLTRESNTRPHPEDVVRHEYGHAVQQKLLDPVTYLVNIGIPSMADLGTGKYEEKPWEITAEEFGQVEYTKHPKEKVVAGLAYLGFSMLFGPAGSFIWPFTYLNHGEEAK